MPLTEAVKKEIRDGIAAQKQRTSTLSGEVAALAETADTTAAQAAANKKQDADARVADIKAKIAAERKKIPADEPAKTAKQVEAARQKVEEQRKQLEQLGYRRDGLETSQAASRDKIARLEKQIAAIEGSIAKRPAADPAADQLKAKKEAHAAAKAAVELAKANLDEKRTATAGQKCPWSETVAWWKGTWKPPEVVQAEKELADKQAALETKPDLDKDEQARFSKAQKSAAGLARQVSDKDALAKSLGEEKQELAKIDKDLWDNEQAASAARKLLDEEKERLDKAAKEVKDIEDLKKDLDQADKDAGKALTDAQAKVDAVEAAYEKEAKQRDTAAGGHCAARHGPQVTDDKLKKRLTEGKAPDGVYSPTASSCKFASNKELVETQKAAERRFLHDQGIPDLNTPIPGATAPIPANVNHGRVVGTGFDGDGVAVDQKYPATRSHGGTGNCTSTHSSFEWNGNKWVIKQHYPR